MPRAKRRNTLKDAEQLYPNEWVIFVDPRFDKKTSTFIDGVIHWHGKNQAEGYRQSAAIEGDRAKFFTGSIPYRTVTLEDQDAVGKKVA